MLLLTYLIMQDLVRFFGIFSVLLGIRKFSLSFIMIQNDLDKSEVPETKQTQQSEGFMDIHLLTELQMRKWLQKNKTLLEGKW